MDRMMRVAALWSWLPEFRAVAETEHVTEAARRLHVSPSAVSRTIRLLEDDVGQQLFERVGRRVELNEPGRHLLHGVRSAMRLVDESLALIAGTQLVGPVRVATVEPLTSSYVMPALAQLAEEQPDLEPCLRTVRPEEIAGALLRGELDVAFMLSAPEVRQLTVAHLGDSPRSVFAGPGHRLHGRRWPTSEVQDPFVVLDDGDAWPASVPRNVRLRVDSLPDLMAACASGRYLAVLPDAVAQRRELAEFLHRLSGPELPPMPLFAAWRERLELPGRAEAIVDAVRTQFA